MLTDRAVKAAVAPAGKRVDLSDGQRLYLRVSCTGGKVWRYRSQIKGKKRWRTLGRYPGMSLLDARNAAAALAALSDRKTVREAYAEFSIVVKRDYDRPDHIVRRFERDILPELKLDTPIDKITRTQVSDLLQKIVKRGSPVQANRTLPDVKRFFTYCEERGWINTNPASGITRLSVGGREGSRDRTLAVNEIGDLVGILLTDRFALQTRIALALMLLTGQRSGEILGINKEEIHGYWWVLPAQRNKSRREQKVYLSPQTRALLRLAFKYFSDAPFNTDHQVLARAAARMRTFDPPFTPHDIRRTVATRLADDHNVMPHVVEKMLNHTMQGPMAVYNRAEYLKERRNAWRLWGTWLAEIRRNVVRTARRDAATSLIASSITTHPKQSDRSPSSSSRSS